MPSWESRAGSGRLQPRDSEEFARIRPDRGGSEARLSGDGAKAFERVFSGNFGVDGFAVGKPDVPAGDRDVLAPARDEIHLNTPRLHIVRRVVIESRDIEIGPKFAIGPHQQVAVEGGRHAQGIIVGGVQNARVLFEIEADKKTSARKASPDRPEE